VGDVTSERRGHVAVLTLANPARRNALDPALCAALATAIGELQPSGARCAVLTGAGDGPFCAGFDVTALPAQHELGALARHPFDALIDAASATDVPIVCALNGAAFGGGVELAATCDLRIGHDGVTFMIPPAKLGIVYAARGLVRLSALLGESRARAMLLAARTVAATEALAWGLLDEVVAPERVLPRAVALAEDIAALAPLAVQGMRRSFEALLRARAALDADTAADLDRVRLRAWASKDAAEARLAFAQKRKPTFTGE
jgi:enoyl-CoA hydratase/carnithine racemase